MQEKILIISERPEDIQNIEASLEIDRFQITHSHFLPETKGHILSNGSSLILADYDFVKGNIETFYDFQKSRSASCLIFYGDTFKADEIVQILQQGAYTVIPREHLTQRVYDAVIGGLENRKSLLEILGLMDELKDVNRKLHDEKDAFRMKNQELSFINRLSREVAYDLNWDEILPRIIETGLGDVLDYSMFCVLFGLGRKWNLSVHLADSGINLEKKSLKVKLLAYLFPKRIKPISNEEIHFKIISTNKKIARKSSPPFNDLKIFQLSLAGKRLGAIAVTPRKEKQFKEDADELLTILSNILSLSLNNAQEYHELKKAAVTDNLTGIYNRKGFTDFLKKEFQRAKRYNKDLSLVMIDINGFKLVNDSLGHQAGDYCLQELANQIKRSVREPDIVARYGGDEFAILLPETEPDEAEVLMKRLVKKLRHHIIQWGVEILILEICYGISNTRELQKKDNEESLIRHADVRLYMSKEAFQNNVSSNFAG